jgi:hypothetical protein
MRPHLLELLLAATLAWPSPAAVLCVAPDGHVAVEAGSERCTGPADHHQDAQEPAHASLAPGEACCGSCTDLPIDTPVMRSASRPDDSLCAPNQASAHAPGMLAAGLALASPQPDRGQQGGVPHRSVASRLRGTIILRC